jgi:coenzyme F420-0:L-glutamate ligase/coenzyme F420-1:gamma-L-glutamate ligase
MPHRHVLTDGERRFLQELRYAVLATTAPDGRARLVPVCYALSDEVDSVGRPILYTPIDEKQKKTDNPHDVARVRDLLVLPELTLVFDRWDEDWDRLAWLRIYGYGELLDPLPSEDAEHAAAVVMLRARYPQYATHDLEHRPIIRVALERVVSWGEFE